MTRKLDELKTSAIVSPARRRFLNAAGRAGLLTFGAPGLAATWAREACGALAPTKTNFPGLYGLELDGVFTGLLAAFSGGSSTADVVKEPVGADRVQHKSLGTRRVEPITIETGLVMAKPLYSWIKSSIEPNSKFPPKSGAIIEFDSTYKAVGRREFFNALLTEVEFPLCDASSKDQARLSITLAPESVRLGAAKGGVLSTQARTQKSSMAANFRLRIEGLEQSTSLTNRIEPMSIKVTVPASTIGEGRVASPTAPVIDIPNLVVTMSDTRIGPIYQWLDDFVVKGHNSERRGVLDYLTPNLQSVLLSVNFFNLGIVKVAPEPWVAGTDQQRRSRVEMYCEAVTLA